MKIKSFGLAALSAMLLSGAAYATDVKIGVMNDRSGIYSDISGEGSVVAAQLAAEDVKAAEKGMEIGGIRLLRKEGGKSGLFQAS